MPHQSKHEVTLQAAVSHWEKILTKILTKNPHGSPILRGDMYQLLFLDFFVVTFLWEVREDFCLDFLRGFLARIFSEDFCEDFLARIFSEDFCEDFSKDF